MEKCARLGLVTVLVLAAAPSGAQAFTVKVHIHLANAIRDDLVRNWQQTGRPVIRLMGPEGAPVRHVRLREADAAAIRDFPELFRGGAIGPDNTVMPGLTDPSHAWTFAPFSQCQALVDEARTSEERAYALGCFLHGISDNTAHHMVNFFTGETFTLYPIAAARDGELHWSLLNVVRHMMTESRFEDALAASVPGALEPDRMRHRIATDLYRRVYLDRTDGTRGLWHYFAGELVARKNDALAAAQLEGFDPTDDLELTIEQVRARGLGRRLDRRVISAYVDFLKTGAPVGVLEPGQMAPADYVLLLPEIVADLQRLLVIVDLQGEDDLRAVEREFIDQECDSILVVCPEITLRRRLYRHLFAPAEDGGPSRMDQVVARKSQELDRIVLGYIQTIERLSNLIVVHGVAGATREQIAEALRPMSDAIEEVTDFPYDLLFPQWAVTIIDRVEWIKGFMESAFVLIKQELKTRVVDFVAKHLEDLKNQLLALAPQVVQDLRQSFADLRAALRDRLTEEKLRAVGLDLTPADGMMGHPTQSVWAMNAFNSVAGVLASPEVVHLTGPSGFYSGPVSFDASHQLEYNQLAVCDDLRPIFYPCGTSAGEMLQPDYRRCEALPDEARIDPPVECHRFDATSFAESPTPDDCRRQTIDEIIAPWSGHVGSYTGAFPPKLVDNPPECVDPFGDVDGDVAGQGDLERRTAGLGGDGAGSSFMGDAGCSIGGSGSRGAALLLLVAVAFRVRRRG